MAPGAVEISSPSRAASFHGSRRTHSRRGQEPHGSSLSCRSGAGPRHRRGLYPVRALLCEKKPHHDTGWKRKQGMGDGHNPSHWNAGLTGQATRLAPLPLSPRRFHGAVPRLGSGLCSVLALAVYPLFLRGLDASWSGWMSFTRIASQSIGETLPGDPCLDCFSLQTCFRWSRSPPGEGGFRAPAGVSGPRFGSDSGPLQPRKHGLSTSSEAGSLSLQPTIIPRASRLAVH